MEIYAFLLRWFIQRLSTLGQETGSRTQRQREGFLTGWICAEVTQTGDLAGDPPAAVTQQLPPWRRREGTCRFSGTDVNGRVASRRRESLYTEKISVGGLKAAPCTSADKDLDSRDFR